MVGWIAYALLVPPAFWLIYTGRALGDSPLSAAPQLLGLAVMVWARATFGMRSLHAGSTATAGGLVTTGPYRFVRHPIYAGGLLVLAGSLLAHHELQAVGCVAAIVAALVVRMAAEERAVRAMYPEYADYARRTRRVIPFLL